MATPSMQSQVEKYLDDRRRLGFVLQTNGAYLMSFARFVDRIGHTGPLTSEVILAWAQRDSAYTTPSIWARRLINIRRFLKQCAQMDGKSEVPETDVFGRLPGRPTPHVYTEAEVVELLAAARRLPPVGTLRPATYEAFFGLLAATGLRLSEALRLKCADVDLTEGLLTVRQSKWGKSRLVPLHPTVTQAMAQYLTLRQRLSSASDDHFFVSRAGTAIGRRTVETVFGRLRTEMGWVARGSHPAPRIHDLRHSFICRRVMLWHKQGADIENAMLALSTYVGHVAVSYTYWYLTGVPELMAVAGQRFELFSSDAREVSHA